MAGLAAFEWNQTVTSEQKHIQRVRKLAEIENKKKSAKIQKERDFKRKELDEVRAQQRALREEQRKERELLNQEKEEERAQAQKAEEGNEKKAAVLGDRAAKEGDKSETQQTPEGDEPTEDRPKREKRERKEKNQKMVYKRKDADAEEVTAPAKPQMVYQAKVNK